MSKPSWNDAPEWAKYLAQDDDGDWYWYEEEPQAFTHSWGAIGRQLFANCSAEAWRESLEQRTHPSAADKKADSP
jgi:hypothetical protein